MQKVRHALVTGGAGFIGSHLVDALVAGGSQVTILDNLSTGHRSNINHHGSKVKFIEDDIRNAAVLDGATKGCDVVFHQAALVSVTQSVQDPSYACEVNDLGTVRVLDAARQNGVRRVVMASSSAVYGDDPQLPKTEKMAPRPLSPYAVQKLTGEYYATVFSGLYGLETVCLRYFNVFGPRQDPSSPYSGVISIFMTKAATGVAPTIYGDGSQSRDFVYVSDVVNANLLAATHPMAPGRIFNVGTGSSIRILDLWQMIAELSDVEIGPVFAPPRTGDIHESVADASEIKKTMGYISKIKLRQGLIDTFGWYRNKT